MPGILSRFKRSPSRSSSHSSIGDLQQDISSSSLSQIPSGSDDTDTDDRPPASTHGPVLAPPANLSPNTAKTRSTFVENFDSPAARLPSQPAFVTPDGSKRKPGPIEVADSAIQPSIGTPKLVLTKEGSDSPHSFNDSFGNTPPSVSPSQSLSRTFKSRKNRSSLSPSDRGLDHEDDGEHTDGDETPVSTSFGADTSVESDSMSSPPTAAVTASTPSVTLSPDPAGRPRQGSIVSTGSRVSGSGSIVSKLTGRPASPSNLSANQPDENRRSSLHLRRRKGKKNRKDRAKSISSVTSGQGSIAAALARSGMSIASPVDPEFPSQTVTARKASSKRSPFLVRGKDAVDDDSARRDGDEDLHRLDYDDEDDDEEDESESDFDDDLPVTGFAVASNRRQADFHALFTNVDEGDYLIEDYGCALSKDILVQGRLYVSENHLCFHANIFGWVTDLVIPFTDIKTIEKKMTALVIPNAIQVSTADSKYTFASLISRDTTYDVMMNIWRLCNPNAVMSIASLPSGVSRPSSVNGDTNDNDAGAATSSGEGSTTKGHGKTECECGKENKHYAEVALDTIFHTTPEKIYNLMFNSEWFKEFLSENQKLRDIEMSDWRPSPDNKALVRSTSYIKPLNGSIGPKQTKCHITDEHQHRDYDRYITMLTTTKTPDVPSGGVFSVKTRTCITWAGSNASRVLVTTTVEWTGKSWVKGIIEKSAIEGQKTYHDDLEKGMKAYMKEHPEEFGGPDGDQEGEGTQGAAAADSTKQDAPPSEAAAYAARKRKERQDADFWSMQGGLDSVFSGASSIASGIGAVFSAAANLVADQPLSKETLFGLIIGLLVFSNLYTFFAYRPSESVDARRAKRLGGERATVAQDEVEEAVRAILREGQVLPLEEARELMKLLENVETRLDRLRLAAMSAVSATTETDMGVTELD